MPAPPATCIHRSPTARPALRSAAVWPPRWSSPSCACSTRTTSYRRRWRMESSRARRQQHSALRTTLIGGSLLAYACALSHDSWAKRGGKDPTSTAVRWNSRWCRRGRNGMHANPISPHPTCMGPGLDGRTSK
jgi:hypothetical protein